MMALTLAMPNGASEERQTASLWIDDTATVARARELYPPSPEMRAQIENDRRLFLGGMAKIKDHMVLGIDKNVYVEPAIWTIEWARDFYDYPVTRSKLTSPRRNYGSARR
jgi:hypothetical protein